MRRRCQPVCQSSSTGTKQYLSQHDLQSKIEVALNATLAGRPDEPLAVLVGQGQS